MTLSRPTSSSRNPNSQMASYRTGIPESTSGGKETCTFASAPLATYALQREVSSHVIASTATCTLIIYHRHRVQQQLSAGEETRSQLSRMFEHIPNNDKCYHSSGRHRNSSWGGGSRYTSGTSNSPAGPRDNIAHGVPYLSA